MGGVFGVPVKQWRALLSVPIEAEDERRALGVAQNYANGLLYLSGGIVAGHLELLVEEGDVPCYEDPDFRGLHGIGG